MFCQSYAGELLIAVNERDIYRFKDSDDNWQGKDIELINAVFRRLPYTHKVTAMPWPRVLESIKSGSVDMTLAATILPERQVYALFSKEAFRYSHYRLFVHTEKLALFHAARSLADLTSREVVIGALRGAIYSAKYYRLLQTDSFAEKIVYIGHDQSMVSMALKGRVDAYIDSEIEGNHYLSQRPHFQEYITPLFRITNDAEAKSGLMFSKKTVSQSVVDEFDKALLDLHNSGEYERISAKFNPSRAFPLL